METKFTFLFNIIKKVKISRAHDEDRDFKLVWHSEDILKRQQKVDKKQHIVSKID